MTKLFYFVGGALLATPGNDPAQIKALRPRAMELLDLRQFPGVASNAPPTLGAGTSVCNVAGLQGVDPVDWVCYRPRFSTMASTRPSIS
jgi:hypothetical protein